LQSRIPVPWSLQYSLGKAKPLSEIKSTIDLMMERTRGMALSAEERADLRQEDLRKRARGLKLKLVQAPDRAEEILSPLSEESAEDRRFLESYLWELMIGEMPTDAKTLKYLDLMEKLPGAQARRQALQRLRDAFREVAKSDVIDKKKILTREKKRLAALGISGSAVLPKIPKENILGGEFLERIESLRRELRGTKAT
jgi:hypothetical protein